MATDVTAPSPNERKWYVLRDLKRANSKSPAYKELAEKGFTVFTPMKDVLATKVGRTERKRLPVLRDLLFVRSSRSLLDEEIRRTPTLQYRFLRGCYMVPMTVRDDEMEQFIAATQSTTSIRYYSPEEITDDMIGGKVRLIGGALGGRVVTLMKLRGSKKKRIFVSIPSVIVAAVEVNPEYLQMVEE